MLFPNRTPLRALENCPYFATLAFYLKITFHIGFCTETVKF